jgi:acetoin utilization deacetylase AcuC-like enzyme
VPLRRYTPAPAYLEAFRAALQQVTRHFSPELVLISAGFDAHARDPLGGLLLHDEDFQELTLEVLSLADRFAGGRVVSVLEGGYNLTTLGDTVATHLETLKQG